MQTNPDHSSRFLQKPQELALEICREASITGASDDGQILQRPWIVRLHVAHHPCGFD